MYSFLGAVNEYYETSARKFFEDFSPLFAREHAQDIDALRTITTPDHITDSSIANSYMTNKYRVTLTSVVYWNLLEQMEIKQTQGGSVIIGILNNHMQIQSPKREVAGKEHQFAAMVARGDAISDMPDEDEGIPGHNAGSANTDKNAPLVLPKLQLGPRPMDDELYSEVREELDGLEEKFPAQLGQRSLVEELDHKIKREPSEDVPDPSVVPLPRPLARDIAMEVQKIKQHRDRFQIPPKTNGVRPGVSVCMFTFHNTSDSVNCLDFSGDNQLVAVGTAESYIRVWTLDGKPLPSSSSRSNGDHASQTMEDHPLESSSSRRLIGHSGPIYAISFAPSTPNDDVDYISTTTCKAILSSSADNSIRLWSLDTWTCLAIYKGHTHPVWDVKWSPYGHYFLSGSYDHTARLWSTDRVTPLRIFAGHDKDVDVVAFHPNNAYVFSAGSDKTVRMWDNHRGTALRMFTGHQGSITAIECAQDGKTLASADDTGAIILWNLASGRRIKRMRGHGKGGIWSLAWSVESSLLVSAGMDCTVRAWDPLMHTSESNVGAGGKGAADGAGGKGDGAGGGSSTAGAVTGVPGKKTKAKDATVTPDQVGVYPTKKSPVYKVAFTNMNCVLAGSAFMPHNL